MQIAFFGEPGTNTEIAAAEYFGAAAELVSHPSFEAIFAAVETGRCAQGIVPIENSRAGSIHRNYDLLLRHSLEIVGEHYLRVQHCLVALPGVALADIRRVVSHPQALAQCERYLQTLPGVQLEATGDTAGNVRLIKEQQDRATAAVASRRAAELYGMQVLAEGIEDEAENYTRFLVIAPPGTVEPPASQETKTTLVFTLRNQPGALFKALSVFALRDIDLSKIESRPLVGKLWEYLFYVDIAGSTTDESVKRAIEHLGEYAPLLRVLGSYPRHRL